MHPMSEDRHESISQRACRPDHPRACDHVGAREPLQRRNCELGDGDQRIRKQPSSCPDGAESVGAQLHHQPTPQSVQRAEAAPNTELNDIVNRAKGLDGEGKTKECMELVASGKLRLQ